MSGKISKSPLSVCLIKKKKKKKVKKSHIYAIVSEKVLTATEIPGDGERGRLYLTLYCYNQNDFCIQMGSDGIRFDVSLILRDKVTRQCRQTTTFEEREEPKWNRTGVILHLTSLTPYRHKDYEFYL